MGSDLDRGIANIHQMHAGFDPARLSDIASDIFFKVQAGWMNRDMREAAAVVTPEMSDDLQKACSRLRGQGRVNRLQKIAVRSVDVTDARHAAGPDFVSVHLI